MKAFFKKLCSFFTNHPRPKDIVIVDKKGLVKMFQSFSKHSSTFQSWTRQYHLPSSPASAHACFDTSHFQHLPDKQAVNAKGSNQSYIIEGEAVDLLRDAMVGCGLEYNTHTTLSRLTRTDKIQKLV